MKCSAYLQSWPQGKLSDISFDIGPKRAWIEKDNVCCKEIVHNSDCYVFCLIDEKDKLKANVLDLGSWKFYVKNTQSLIQKFGKQKRISLSSLEKVCDPLKIQDLNKHVDSELGLPSIF